jgi:DNA-binding winged helix-turn-helix (wHTH) protein
MTTRFAFFDSFELNLATGELRRDGAPVRLEHQPARALMVLVARAGELVTRDELRREIWDDDTFVDFDRGLNYCIRHLRAALGEDARQPRFIQTVPRQGYRFIAEVRDFSIETPTVDEARPHRVRRRDHHGAGLRNRRSPIDGSGPLPPRKRRRHRPDRSRFDIR